MTIRHYALPVAAVRDLLGIVRTLYAWHKQANASDERLPVLHTAGRKLVLSLQLARHDVGTMGHSAAWSHAEDAIELLGEALYGSAELGQLMLEAKRRALTTATEVTPGERLKVTRLLGGGR